MYLPLSAAFKDWCQERTAGPGQERVQTGQEGGQGQRQLRPQAADVSATVVQNDRQADDTDRTIDDKLKL